MGEPQVSYCIHGTRDILGIFCQSKWEGSCSRACERSRRRCEANRQSQDISDECPVCHSSGKGSFVA